MSDHDAAPLGALGDVPPSELRAHLHRMADWVADYREGIERRPIVPAVAPGVVTGGLTTSLPEAPAVRAGRG